jgi:hypothetical protein
VDGWKIDPTPTLMRDQIDTRKSFGESRILVSWVPELQRYAVAYTSYSTVVLGFSSPKVLKFRTIRCDHVTG